MQIDLHTHSYFSDGECSPEEVIEEAKKRNVSVLSITDHNFLPENEIPRKYAKNNSIILIDGIEISTVYRSLNSTTSLHILGYGRKLERIILNKGLEKTIAGYNNRAHAIIDKLNTLFPKLLLDFHSLRISTKEVYISRNTLARILVEHLGNTLSIKDTLKKYVFVEEDDAWMMTPEESFSLIASAGGIPILAHSGRELRKIGLAKYEEMVAHFVKEGLLGLEVYYPKHTAEEISFMKDIANKYNLFITGGSDWHGKVYTPDISVGYEVKKENFPFLNDKRISPLS